jgi:hypothetical protein
LHHQSLLHVILYLLFLSHQNIEIALSIFDSFEYLCRIRVFFKRLIILREKDKRVFL